MGAVPLPVEQRQRPIRPHVIKANFSTLELAVAITRK